MLIFKKDDLASARPANSSEMVFDFTPLVIFGVGFVAVKALLRALDV